MNELQVRKITEILMGTNETIIGESYDIKTIETEEVLNFSIDMLSVLKERYKELEDKRKQLNKPFREGLAALNSEFKQQTTPLDDAIKSISPKIMSYQRKLQDEQDRIAKIEQEKKQAELLALSEKQKELGNDAGGERLLEMAVSVKAKPEEVGRGGFTGTKSSIKKIWDYEIIDIAALAKARPDLVEVNKGVMRKEVHADNVIAGVRFFQKDSLATRG